ncbi:MAG TPA: hypothetical protein VMT70_15920, partial [Vicinamibacteria bacterium]|nr:hypothetical protein [Vicinamibacteria bacterium]
MVGKRGMLGLAGAGLVVVFLVARLGPPRTDADVRKRLEARRPSPNGLNVVVVTLDTLRSDRLGC